MITKTYSSERTAGLSSQTAVEAIGNRYALILVGARRMRELGRGDAPRVDRGHGHAVTALLEIEAGKVGIDYLLREQDLTERKPRRVRNTF
jgi:DNA-directed RNA polymerase subunit omega